MEGQYTSHDTSQEDKSLILGSQIACLILAVFNGIGEALYSYMSLAGEEMDAGFEAGSCAVFLLWRKRRIEVTGNEINNQKGD